MTHIKFEGKKYCVHRKQVKEPLLKRMHKLTLPYLKNYLVKKVILYLENSCFTTYHPKSIIFNSSLDMFSILMFIATEINTNHRNKQNKSELHFELQLRAVI